MNDECHNVEKQGGSTGDLRGVGVLIYFFRSICSDRSAGCHVIIKNRDDVAYDKSVTPGEAGIAAVRMLWSLLETVSDMPLQWNRHLEVLESTAWE
jgi:hypothetical protein